MRRALHKPKIMRNLNAKGKVLGSSLESSRITPDRNRKSGMRAALFEAEHEKGTSKSSPGYGQG
jgi:hypothetical protein